MRPFMRNCRSGSFGKLNCIFLKNKNCFFFLVVKSNFFFLLVTENMKICLIVNYFKYLIFFFCKLSQQNLKALFSN